MGNAKSSTLDVVSQDIWWTNSASQHDTTIGRTDLVVNSEPNIIKSHVPEVNTETEKRRKELAEDFEKFKEELARKHEKRKQLIAEKKKEMSDIRDELLREKQKNEELRELLRKSNENREQHNCDVSVVSSEDFIKIKDLKEENEELRNQIKKLLIQLKENSIIAEKNKELRISLAEMQKDLQSLNTEVVGFEKERIDYQEHISALKDVIRVSKEMLAVRENQIEQLKKKLTSIEELLASKEMNILSDDLRHEYERQLRNIRNLRTLYEERQRVDKREKDNLHSVIDELKKNLEDEQNKSSELQERITELENENSLKYDKIQNLESGLGISKAEYKELKAEMAVINQLFSQILMGFNNEQDVDLDNLIKLLEENHDLLTNIVTNEESSEVSALPKVLLDLVNQVNEIKKMQNTNSIGTEESTDENNQADTNTVEAENDAQVSQHQLNSPKEIVENLPKVWRVLIELLSHQCAPNNVLIDSSSKPEGNEEHPCYKSVQTPAGPRSVLSVSQTFIRLKDLILEKKSLEKETTRLKQLNIHLEGRLQDQEKRLLLVSSELSKTWHVVGKMQKQHQHLHTQEKILRYELAQKRKLLTELKQELEYCREKWLQARKKNSNTEEQWKQLRTEFTSRKTVVNDDCNNSIESGYSDDKSSSEDEHGFEQDVSISDQNVQNEEEEIVNRVEQNEIDCIPVETIGSGQVEESQENLETSPTILEVVKTEIAKIENTLQDDILNCASTSSSCRGSSTNEVMHSLETEKTDLVQNNSNERQTLQNALEVETGTPQTSTDEQVLAKKLCIVENISEEGNYKNINLSNTTESENCDRIIEEIPQEAGSSTGSAEHKSQGQEQTDIPQTSMDEQILVEKLCIVENISEESNYENINSSNTTENENSNRIIKEISQEAGSSTGSAEHKPQDQEQTATNKSPSELAQEFVDRREARMKHLEEQCKQLYTQVASTAIRSMQISSKVNVLHETYGENSQNTDLGESTDVQDSADISVSDIKTTNDSTETEEQASQ